MSRGPVFVAFYASDYISGTRKIPPMERLVYMEIIALIYDEGGPIEYENRDLARFIGVTAAVCKRAVDGLVKRRKITLEGGVIFNERAGKELAKAGARSAGAKASADARWAKTETKVGKVNQDFDQNRSPILPENPNDINDPDMRTHPPRNATKTQTQIKTGEEREVRDAPAALAPSGPRLEDYVSPEQASDFRKHRVALKAKLTPGAEKGICRELVKVITAGFDPGEALETGMAMGWKAIKADWIINHAAKDHGHGNRSTGARSSANEASAAADDHWAEFDRRAGRGHDDGGYYGTPDSAPNVRDDDRFSSEGFLEGVLVRPEAFRR
jgi:uncharacterized protein YdaU (DUF1376 family)